MAIQLPIYMDNHATTPVDPRVLERDAPYFNEKFGNAASRSHVFGWTAEEAVELRARADRHSSSAPRATKEIVFTSGATESDNLALKGVAEFYRDKGNHIITSADRAQGRARHAASASRRRASRSRYLDVGKDGLRRPRATSKRAITDKTILVSIMLANNEVGTVQPHRRDRQDHLRARRPSPHATPCRASARCRSTSRR